MWISSFRAAMNGMTPSPSACPPKDQPWYHILVDNGGYESYVAERNLEPSQLLDPVNHPFVASFFQELKDGVYVPSMRKN